MMQAEIAALTANGSFVFPFCVGKRVFHLVLETTILSYICGIPSCTNETKFPIISIMRSLPLCDKVALCRRPLTFHENCNVSYYKNISYKIFCLTEFIDCYKNLTLRKYGAIQYVCMYICTYTHAHTYIHTYEHTYIHMFIHTHICTYIHTHMHIHTYICIYWCIHTSICAYILTNTYTHMHIHTHICTYGTDM